MENLIGIFFERWLLGCVDANAAVWNADETNLEEKSSVLFSDAVAERRFLAAESDGKLGCG